LVAQERPGIIIIIIITSLYTNDTCKTGPPKGVNGSVVVRPKTTLRDTLPEICSAAVTKYGSAEELKKIIRKKHY
jgi:hypothetical protein